MEGGDGLAVDQRLAAGEAREPLADGRDDVGDGAGLRDGDAAGLAALIWSAGHGAVDLALAGHGHPEKRTDDPVPLMRLLLRHLAVDRAGPASPDQSKRNGG